jgi:hypothetical protein
MAFIDRRASLRKSTITPPLTLAALVAYAGRCPDCEPCAVEDLGPTRGLATKTSLQTVTITPRVVPSLKNRLAVYARDRGLTLNAAAITLLDHGLDEQPERGPAS